MCKLILKNNEVDYYLTVLKSISKDVSGKLGYAVARNIREFNNSLKEYTQFKNELIVKYGEQKGNEFSLSQNSEKYKDFQNELKPLAEIEHDVPIMFVNAEDVYSSCLTADKIGELFFMIKDGDTNG